jgi:hypothetical protein
MKRSFIATLALATLLFSATAVAQDTTDSTDAAPDTSSVVEETVADTPADPTDAEVYAAADEDVEVEAEAETEVEDIEAPSFVENLEATPGDGEIQLKWDAATDDVEVTGYAIFYGTSSLVQAYLDLETSGGEPESLEFEYDTVIDVENVVEYTIETLDNDTTYYFSVVAVDAAGNESLSYSNEASATPVAAPLDDDGTPPTVVSAVASRCTTVELTFSEHVEYPEANPGEAFTIEDFDTLEFLSVTGVTESPLENTITLTMPEMTDMAQYRLTVGVDIADDFGNPMVSGTSDTAIFTGIACPEEAPVVEEPPVEETPVENPNADQDAPKLENVDVISPTELWLTFNEEVAFPEEVEAASLFSIFDGDNNGLEVTEVDRVDNDPTILILSTSEHLINTEYFASVSGLLDVDGNATIGDFKSSAAYNTFTSEDVEEEVEVVVPSLDNISNLVANVADQLVNLSWASAGNAVDHYLYVSTDGGTTYKKKAELGKEASSYAFEGVVEGQNYLFKVVSVDADGNQSEGLVATAALPSTGPGLALLAAASLLGGAGLSRRRKKQL